MKIGTKKPWNKANTRDRVTRIRDQRGMTVTALAAACGVTEQGARNWLRGKTVPRANQIEKLEALEQ
jgi:transcriptional regulator with XRE-family HTH domain